MQNVILAKIIYLWRSSSLPIILYLVVKIRNNPTIIKGRYDHKLTSKKENITPKENKTTPNQNVGARNKSF